MWIKPFYRNRAEAGQKLAERLKPAFSKADTLVLALPRGGVPVAFEIAQALHCDLDVYLVRKIGVPGREELAMGAVASGDVRVLNDAIIRDLRIPQAAIESATEREQREIVRREHLYREGRPALTPRGRTVLLVDDGLATGATMLAAARAVRQQRPARIAVAVPVGSVEACEEFRHQVDELLCAVTPYPFQAVGVWYEDFSQTSDEEVRELLERAAHQYSA
jgi:predicted phosphoribosyltransferase